MAVHFNGGVQLLPGQTNKVPDVNMCRLDCLNNDRFFHYLSEMGNRRLLFPRRLI